MHDGLETSLGSERLQMRPWREADLEPFAKLNADARVAEFLPSPLTRLQSDALAERIQQGFTAHGFGLWAVERIDEEPAPFIGFIGLSVPSFDLDFTPCVEIGWRLAPGHWGLGLATEGARAVQKCAFGWYGLDELVSFTAVDNLASRRVMEKIGMRHAFEQDFDHPALPAGHPLQRHVLYRSQARRQTRAPE